MSLDVTSLLNGSASKDASLPNPAPAVSRPLEPDTVDPGNLLLIESNELSKDVFGSEERLTSLARDNAQLLLNRLWELPRQKAALIKSPRSET